MGIIFIHWTSEYVRYLVSAIESRNVLILVSLLVQFLKLDFKKQ